MSKEAMKLALEALEGNTTNPVIDPEQAAIEDQAITALREALAEQPAQQKPVFTYDQVKAHIQAAMMSAAQRTWVGLSDEESTVIWANSQSVDEAIRATEKQLMENNI